MTDMTTETQDQTEQGALTTARELVTDAEIWAALAHKRVATIGAKGPGRGPANEVPELMSERGYDVVAVSPKLEEAFGNPAVKRVDMVDHPIDMVQIFRRGEAVPGHVPEILAMSPRPKVVWLQLGICNDEATAELVAHGISVVQDRCVKIELRRAEEAGALEPLR